MIHRMIYLARFGYKLNTSCYIFGYLLEWCIEIRQIFLNSGQILTIEKSQKAYNFSTSNF